MFDSVATWDELLFCHHASKFILTTLSKSPVLRDVDLPTARELELGPVKGLRHVLLALQLGADIDIMTCPKWTLASVPQGFPEAPRIPVWSLDWGQHASHECPLGRAVSKVP